MDWRQLGACRDADPDLFFPPRGGSTRAALALCARCHVRGACLDYALRFEDQGIFGMTTAAERERLRERLGIRLQRRVS